jgi:hypothetical protein
MTTKVLVVKKALSILGCVIAAVMSLTVLAFFARAFDPIWSVNEIRGTVIGGGEWPTPNVVIQYYKSVLAVTADDGRIVSVSSERRTAAKVGERIIMQERVGLFGTLKYVEIPAR